MIYGKIKQCVFSKYAASSFPSSNVLFWQVLIRVYGLKQEAESSKVAAKCKKQRTKRYRAQKNTKYKILNTKYWMEKSAKNTEH